MKCMAKIYLKNLRKYTVCGRKAEFLINGDSLCKEHAEKEVTPHLW